MDKFEANRQYFGNDSFRQGQEPLIDAILHGRDCLGIMPTGGGKSLCYQIPALLLPGLTLVISPLISLMKDQVAALTSAGVAAAFLNSSLDGEEYGAVCRDLDMGVYKILYIAPERLENQGFVHMISRQRVSLVAVDEAHCISQWGQDFRPSYLSIPSFLARLPEMPVVAAFTATATTEVRQDIIRLLELKEPLVLVTGFDRPNLYFEVLRPENKSQELIRLITARAGRSGIVYCATRARVEQVCAQLNRRGISATEYHAGLSDDLRRQNQEDFQYDRKTVMVATNAFGMGIDKSNVAFVIHYNMPKSLEAYYQEAGRAGRDGEAADCILLFSSGDVSTAKYLIENSGDNSDLDPDQREAIRRQDYNRLNIMIDYCKNNQCLRGYILGYFGQGHEQACGSCGYCRGEYTMQDVTVQAQMILSCIKRIKDRLGYYVGASLVIQVLCGGKSQRIRDLGLDSLSTYAIMKDSSRALVQQYISHLEQLGYLQTNLQYMTLCLTKQAGEILYRGGRVEMRTRVEAEKPALKLSGSKSGPAATDSENPELFEILRSLRASLARKEGIPPYIVFSNATLTHMANRLPRTEGEFLQIPGVGQVKSTRYAKPFLAAIQEYLDK